MSKGVLYFLIIIIVVAIIATVVLNVWVPSTLKPATRIPASLEQEIANPQQPPPQQASAPAVTQARDAMVTSGTALAAGSDAAPPEPRPEPPRVTSIQGNWGRNPFLTLEEIDFLRNPHKYDVEPEPPKVRLSTILTVEGKKTAALNGHYVTVGDFIGTEKVVQISDYGLVLRRENGKTREIRLHDPVIDLKIRSGRN